MLEAHHVEITLPHPMTRNDLVRLEGRDAARRLQSRSDNPYRSGSADGRAWREGFDAASQNA